MSKSPSLADQITELSGHLNAAAARRYALIGELDRTCGWGGGGMLSCAHWLELHCGETPANARELVRVARALADLPLVTEAFERGEISESAVRKITRAATRETQEAFLQFARYGTGAQLDRLCRYWRQVLARAGSEDVRRLLGRYLRFRYDDDGSLRISGRLDADEGEVVRQAIRQLLERAAADEREDDDDRAPERADGPVADPDESGLGRSERLASGDYENRLADALVDMAKRSLDGSGDLPAASDRFQVVVHADLEMLTGQRTDARSELARGTPVPIDIVRRLFCDADLVGIVDDRDGNPLYVGSRTRLVRGKLRRALDARDRTCRFPRCGASAYTEAHHVRRFADGGPTSLANTLKLCRAHHAKLHDGEYLIEPAEPGTFVFVHRSGYEIGRAVTSPDGSSVRRACRTAGREASPTPIEDVHRAMGLHIDETTSRPLYAGDRCDWDLALMLLADRAGLNRPPDDTS